MRFTARTEGKKHLFYIAVDDPREFNILQPYFLATSYDHPKKGNINYMDCLFGGSVWIGSQRHGYGYGFSADVYGTLHNLIRGMYGKKIISGGALDNELAAWNTHNDDVHFSDAALDELAALNTEAIRAKYN